MANSEVVRANFAATGRFGPGSARIEQLDGLRGIAVLLIVATHYVALAPTLDPPSVLALVQRALILAPVGVDLFFVLSGFLIGSILLANRGAENYYSVFYIRRCARLMPLYLVVVGSYVLTKPLLHDPSSSASQWLYTGAGALPDWSYFAYVQNVFVAEWKQPGAHWVSVTWSLAIEEQFYLLLPPLVLMVPSRWLTHVLVVLIAATMSWRVAMVLQGVGWETMYFLLPGRADGLLIGVLGAHFCCNPNVRDWLRRNPDTIMAGLRLSLAMLVALTIAGVSFRSPMMAIFGYTCLALASANLICAALFVDGPGLRKVLTNRWLVEIGGLSYAVYLLHQPVHGLLRYALGMGYPQLVTIGDGALAVVAAGLTLVLAKVSAVVIERPAIAIGHQYQFRRSTMVERSA